MIALGTAVAAAAAAVDEDEAEDEEDVDEEVEEASFGVFDCVAFFFIEELILIAQAFIYVLYDSRNSIRNMTN
jgi:hypothetical protein